MADHLTRLTAETESRLGNTRVSSGVGIKAWYAQLSLQLKPEIIFLVQTAIKVIQRKEHLVFHCDV